MPDRIFTTLTGSRPAPARCPAPPPTGTFADWIMQAKITDNPAGDLVGDMQHDFRCRARKGIALPAIHSAAELRGYLHRAGACNGAVEAAAAVWRRFKRRSRETPPRPCRRWR